MTDASTIRLIVNADELGATPEITEGVLRAHHEGIVTSASIMGTVADLPGLCDELAKAPRLGVGVHFVLVAARPVSDPKTIPSLVDESGAFFGSPTDLVTRWARGKLQLHEIETEMLAQAQRFLTAGVALDHLDTFLHMGFLPPVAQALERVAQRLRIRAIRAAMESPNLSWFTDVQRGLPLAALGALSYVARRRLGALRHGAQSWGYGECGNLGRMHIMEILGRLGPGIHELICHPGTTAQDSLTLAGGRRMYERRLEMETLCDPKIRDALARRGVTLCRFQDVF